MRVEHLSWWLEGLPVPTTSSGPLDPHSPLCVLSLLGGMAGQGHRDLGLGYTSSAAPPSLGPRPLWRMGGAKATLCPLAPAVELIEKSPSRFQRDPDAPLQVTASLLRALGFPAPGVSGGGRRGLSTGIRGCLPPWRQTPGGRAEWELLSVGPSPVGMPGSVTVGPSCWAACPYPDRDRTPIFPGGSWTGQALYRVGQGPSPSVAQACLIHTARGSLRPTPNLIPQL